MVLQSRRVWLAGQFVPAQLEVADGKIVNVYPFGTKTADVDYGNKRIVPGYDELGHDLVRRTVELQVVVLAGLAAALHIQQVDQSHGGGALQARNAHAAFCFGGKSPAGQQADHQRSRQQQGSQFFHHGSDSFLSLLFQSETKFANFAKSFALRAQVYYNGAKNTVAHATELQKGGEGPGKTSRN